MAETKFTTSFIPKKPIQTVGSGGRMKKRSGSALFSIISLFIFLVAIAATAGVFLYKIKLENDIKRQDAELSAATKELDQPFIEESIRLNDRIIGVESLLDNHLSPSQIFFLLEEKTIQTIKFNDLSFSFNNDGDLILSGSGVADGFSSIIQQSDEYGRKGYLRDVIFSNLQNQERGLVSFSFESKVDPEIILYMNALPDIDGQDINNDDDQSGATTTDDLSGLINNSQ